MKKILWSLFLILIWPTIEDRLHAAARKKPAPKAGKKPAAAKRKHSGASGSGRRQGQAQAERRQRSHGGG